MSEALTNQDPRLLRRLLRAKDRMDAASHEDWPVQRLARVSHVSEAHFARSFKEAFGVPPHRYLLTRRIEQATALLRDTDLPSAKSLCARAGRALAPSGASFAISPARTRVRSGRGHALRRTGSAAYLIASSAPRTGQTSEPQFRRSVSAYRAV